MFMVYFARNPMKRSLPLCVAILLAASSLAQTAYAQTILPGDLIKGSGSAVYYYANNSTRLVFPNEATYKTWYNDFSTVKTISDLDLAAIPLGENVTYHAGSRLIKVPSVPKVYAVAAPHTLRWIKTADVAAELYGTDWSTKVDDLSDAFFANYDQGPDITSAADFSLTTEQTEAKIDLSQSSSSAPTITPPAATSTTPTASSTAQTPTAASSTSPLTFTASQPSIQGNDVLTLNASIPSIEPQKLELFFDGVLVNSCHTNFCSGSLTIPISGLKAYYIAEARATTITGQVISQTITLPVHATYSSMVHISVGQAQILPTQLASALEIVDSGLYGRMDIVVDGVDAHGCRIGTHSCQWTDYLTGGVGSVHNIFGVLSDGLGRQYRSADAYITLVDHETPQVVIQPAKTIIYSGEKVDETVTASDSYGIVSMDILKDGVVLKHCEGDAPCTLATGPWTTSSSPLTFVGRATDAKGYVSTSTQAEAVTVINP